MTADQLIVDAVAGKIPAGGSAPLGVSDEDAVKIAKSVNDESARRLRG